MPPSAAAHTPAAAAVAVAVAASAQRWHRRSPLAWPAVRLRWVPSPAGAAAGLGSIPGRPAPPRQLFPVATNPPCLRLGARLWPAAVRFPWPGPPQRGWSSMQGARMGSRGRARMRRPVLRVAAAPRCRLGTARWCRSDGSVKCNCRTAGGSKAAAHRLGGWQGRGRSCRCPGPGEPPATLGRRPYRAPHSARAGRASKSGHPRGSRIPPRGTRRRAWARVARPTVQCANVR
mmetsp:Transcript_61146/g.169545  ORF Transcript_61146/g.169545 Transcript_61146/m.169545 type:complete len:232 (-) Transcript_61146:39-734(-)